MGMHLVYLLGVDINYGVQAKMILTLNYFRYLNATG